MNDKWTRRDFLKKSLIAATATAIVGNSPAAARETEKRKRVLRIAHLTDVHVQPEQAADKGLIACLHHVQNLADKPDFIINGGDSIMDALGTSFSRTKTQWQLWQKILHDECSLPIRHCIGNHDIWGWAHRTKTNSSNVRYGKNWAMEMFGLEQPFYQFALAGWHFFVLDSTQEHPQHAYTAHLDYKQFAWLEANLALVAKNTPVMIVSHIPILSAAAYFDGHNEKTGNWIVPGRWMHTDARRLKDLFLRYPNVRLCISGHIHLLDRVEYNGVTYLCNGAVCGKWWDGAYQECPPGYALIDLYNDGSFAREYVEYGWVPQEE